MTAAAPNIPLDKAYWFQEGPGVRKWQFTTSGVKLLNVGNICLNGDLDLSKTERCLSRDEVEKRYKHFLLDAGDLVIASSGISFDDDGLLRTRGVFVERPHLPLCLNTSTIRFKPKDGSDLRYLRYWLDSQEFRLQITRLVTGSAQQNFGPSHLESVRISLPSLSEQRRIAGQLELADRLRRTRRYALELSDTFLPAAFLELFGSPSSTTKQFPVCELGEETKFIDYRGIAPNKVKRGVRLVTARNVKRGSFELEPQEFIPVEEYNSWMTRGMPQPGDVLFTTEGHTLGSAAKLPSFDKVALGQRLIVLQPGIRLGSDYLLRLILTPWFQDEVAKRSTGSAARGISSRQLAEISVPLPPLELQQKFSVLVERHERLRATQREALRQAEHLFQTLLHQAFSEPS